MRPGQSTNQALVQKELTQNVSYLAKTDLAFQMSYLVTGLGTITIASITWSIFNIAYISAAVKDIFSQQKAV